MSITVRDVEHIAWLARLELTERDKRKFSKQLDHILDHAGKIKEIDLRDVPPTSHVLPLENVFRKDESEPCLTDKEALSNAPKKEKGAFVVPRILAQD